MNHKIYIGDVLESLRRFPDDSVNCVVTSPPYWGLRDYGTASWVGGEDLCDHSTYRSRGDDVRDGDKQGRSVGSRANIQQVCGRCGAVRVDNQIGLEATPEEFVQKMVDVFTEVLRVLRPDGTCWLNLGDSYTGSGKGGNPDHGKQATNRGSQTVGVLYDKMGETQKDAAVTNVTRAYTGIKPKNLVGIPWRVALALQESGWYLRQDIIWAKPNGMPGSQEDRVTSSHEHIFLLTKSPTYWSDFDAIKTPPREASRVRLAEDSQAKAGSHRSKDAAPRTDKQRGHARKHAGFNERWDLMERKEQQSQPAMMRDVWFVSPGGFAEAHFAVMPVEIARRCVLAGCPEGGVVLDPFNGAGTTGLVASRLGCSYIGIELNPEYAAMAERRISGDSPMYNTVELLEAV